GLRGSRVLSVPDFNGALDQLIAHSPALKKGLKSRDCKKVEMLFAHLKRILRLGRLRLRGPSRGQVGFTVAAIAQSYDSKPSYTWIRRFGESQRIGHVLSQD